MDPTIISRPLPVDEAGNVVGDLTCRRCSYQLRGLNDKGKCPECGAPIAQSIYGDLLMYSDSRWVQMLALGVKIILWGILLTVIAAVAGGLLDRLHRGLGQFFGFLGALVASAG